MVSKDYYAFIKRMVQFYYLNETNYDAQVFGLSLQHRHTVLGQTTGQKLIDIEKELKQRDSPPFFKYQLLGNCLAFLFHWKSFSIFLFSRIMGDYFLSEALAKVPRVDGVSEHEKHRSSMYS